MDSEAAPEAMLSERSVAAGKVGVETVEIYVHYIHIELNLIEQINLPRYAQLGVHTSKEEAAQAIVDDCESQGISYGFDVYGLYVVCLRCNSLPKKDRPKLWYLDQVTNLARIVGEHCASQSHKAAPTAGTQSVTSFFKASAKLDCRNPLSFVNNIKAMCCFGYRVDSAKETFDAERALIFSMHSDRSDFRPDPSRFTLRTIPGSGLPDIVVDGAIRGKC